MNRKRFGQFYLDKEKDIIVDLYHVNEDEIEYILRTPNHHTGNLITNIAKICNVETVKDENDMKIITGIIPASINGDNEIVYIFRLGGFKIANIYENGKIEKICRNLREITARKFVPLGTCSFGTKILKQLNFKKFFSFVPKKHVPNGTMAQINFHFPFSVRSTYP